MMQEKTSKIKLIKILEILRQETDEDHYMDSTELMRRLEEQGICIERKTLYTDIELLNQFGYEILCEKTIGFPNKYCLADRLFDVPEVHILLDAVQSAAFITEEKTKVLVDKISSLAGRKRGEILKKNIVEFTTAKSHNEKILYLVSEISQAIINKKKIKFNYFSYDADRNKVYKMNSKGEKRGYKVNPLGTVFDNGNYYLFAYDDFFGTVSHYRIDRMEGVKMTDLDMTPGIEKEIENLPTRKRQLFAMYGGETATVEVQADKELVDVIYDKFGDRVKLRTIDKQTVGFTAEVQVSPTFLAWCCSFGDQLKVTAPKEVVQEIKEYLEKMIKNYG